jgi:hypothetical protein
MAQCTVAGVPCAPVMIVTKILNSLLLFRPIAGGSQ